MDGFNEFVGRFHCWPVDGVGVNFVRGKGKGGMEQVDCEVNPSQISS